MLNIHTMPLGLYQTNTYIVSREGSNKCIVIDPGYEADTILNRTALLGLQVEAILLTHAHFDHLGAVRGIVADTDCRVFVEEKELTLPPTMTDGPIFYTDLYPAEGVSESRLLAVAASLEARMIAAAPSLMPEALPAVTR